MRKRIETSHHLVKKYNFDIKRHPDIAYKLLKLIYSVDVYARVCYARARENIYEYLNI